MQSRIDRIGKNEKLNIMINFGDFTEENKQNLSKKKKKKNALLNLINH